MHNLRRLCALGLLAVGLLLDATPAAAQFSMRTGALGGASGSRATSRPLGGFGPGYNSSGINRRSSGSRGALYGYPYAYSVWVPDYYDYLDSQSQSASPYGYGPQYGPAADASALYGPPPAAAAGPQQPVIINQYFGAPGPPQGNAPDANTQGAGFQGAGANDSQAPGDPIGSPQNYYLIAYKNHAVYTALAYWVEDKTLHYVTTQNTHNQASLDLIDLTLTKSLNRHNDVPFAIPGQ